MTGPLGAQAPQQPEPDDQATSSSTFRRALGFRRRSLPWSERSILLFSLAVVLMITPLWLDPVTLGEVTGRGRDASPSPSGLALETPDSDDSPRPSSQPVNEVPIARDSFNRTVADGWGSAELGGPYVEAGEGRRSVDGVSAIVELDPGTSGQVTLPAAVGHDLTLTYVFSLDTLPIDGEAVSHALLRVSDDRTAYRVAIHVTPTGTVYAGVDALNGDAIEALDGRVLVAQSTGSTAPALNVRAEAVGSDPTTIRARAWPLGQQEPAGWQVTVVDWSGALQGAGTIGLGWQLDATAVQAVTVRHAGLSVDVMEGTDR